MTAPKKARPAPLSLRLSRAERAWIERAAGSMPVSTYIKSRIFDGESTKRRAPRVVTADQRALAGLLAQLGSSRLASNLNQLAKAANSGSLYVDEHTRSQLLASCADVRSMRQILMIALGLIATDSEPVPVSTVMAFAMAVDEDSR